MIKEGIRKVMYFNIFKSLILCKIFVHFAEP